jgi:hypothetical protein
MTTTNSSSAQRVTGKYNYNAAINTQRGKNYYQQSTITKSMGFASKDGLKQICP